MNVIAKLGSENALYRLEKGKVTLTQMIPEFEAECQKVAADQGLSLPAQFSAQKLFSDIGQAEFNKPVLDAAAVLRRHGISTCVLANIWVDDTDQRDGVARILSVLESHFNLVVRSCYAGVRIPELDIFTSALEKLALKPQEAVWLDVDEESIKAAEGLGMTAVQVKDITEALKEIQKLTEIEVTGDLQPPSCDPENVSHGYVNIKPGVRIHYVDLGDGPPVLLCHGFPESWFSWRYQIPALANAGFRVLALDMKGYGDSTAPPEIEEYSQEQIMLDLVTFLDKMGIPQVILVGHDWGGALVWNMAQFHSERVRAVASLNTPLFPVDPKTNPMEKLKAVPIFDYQIYFQKPGVAEAELEKNLERTFKLMFIASNETKSFPSTAGVCQRGGLFVASLDDPPRSAILSESALEYYVQQFTKSGFRGPLNWYRNGERNWRWMCSRPRGKASVLTVLPLSDTVTVRNTQVLLIPAIPHHI
ncbi:bifunctional epoxide hydrolase 2 isoform X2 [Sinocyclocheilus rhinocerous]|uniref:bifunctional epoxide hydrolase 2 isoform X1 n=1 Tax=Sinocyclocheilus rhinocerous TaxID=307959 RepID=UPI0007BA505E|nr:PREDICTED: bifunctional epoxide hydrolase 2 isoform X1 [Sinocyclocheilus rhinocerous]XP_016379415.1 PREDICTED: bifunctional epoxide hydrolase 2 isoform X2 [Sinocyclocheilus rhinocerous]